MDKYKLIVWFIAGMVFAYMTVYGYTWYHYNKSSKMTAPVLE